MFSEIMEWSSFIHNTISYVKLETRNSWIETGQKDLIRNIETEEEDGVTNKGVNVLHCNFFP